MSDAESVTDLAPLDDLEPVRDLTDSGWQSRATRDEPQEQGLLLVSEGGERLPQPLDQLVPLIHTISISGRCVCVCVRVRKYS